MKNITKSWIFFGLLTSITLHDQNYSVFTLINFAVFILFFIIDAIQSMFFDEK